MTLGEQIIQAAVALVADESRPAALVTVERDRTAPLTRAELGAACFYLGEETVEYGDTGDSDVPNGAVLRKQQFEAELRWEGPQSAGDPMRAWTTKRIRANGGTLGGLAAYTREVGSKWNTEPAEIQLQALTITFESGYFTDAEDMEIPG